MSIARNAALSWSLFDAFYRDSPYLSGRFSAFKGSGKFELEHTDYYGIQKRNESRFLKSGSTCSGKDAPDLGVCVLHSQLHPCAHVLLAHGFFSSTHRAKCDAFEELAKSFLFMLINDLIKKHHLSHQNILFGRSLGNRVG